MKKEISIKDLEKAVSVVVRGAGKNVTLPLLSHVYIKASDSGMLLRATNLTIGVECTLSTKGEGSWEVAVPATMFLNSVSSLRGDKVILEGEKGNLRITTKEKKLLIKGMAPDDFPTIPRVEGESLSVAPSLFIDGFKSVYWSAATSDIKPEIASVYLYTNDRELVFVATDSFRLSERKIPLKKISEFPSLLIPAKTIPDMLRILEAMDGDVDVKIHKNQISFSARNIYLTSRVVDGVFPDYRQIIPKEFATDATVLKSDFVDALRISSLFSDKFGHMTLTIAPAKKKCTIETMSENGENSSDIAGAFHGEEVEVGLNIRYVTEALGVISSDSVSISVMNANKPLVLQGVGTQGFLHLVMPMNR